jgi:hypothetical protein
MKYRERNEIAIAAALCVAEGRAVEGVGVPLGVSVTQISE